MMCLIEIGLHAQTLLTILGSIVNIIGGPTWLSYAFGTFDLKNHSNKKEDLRIS